MSIVGKIIGGAAGLALGGPLGALVGALAGHYAVDKLRAGNASEDPEDAKKQIGFTIAVIALGAKMAKADGVVTRDEIEAFRRVFQTPPGEEKNVARLFNQARKDAGGFEPYARQISRMLADSPHVLEELLDCLFHIAKADGKIHPDEITYLKGVAAIFGFDEADFARIREGHLGPDESDPYTVLGVDRSMDDEAIKAAYRDLSRENHPDRLMAQGLPSEFLEVATEKMARINTAYDAIRQERGF